jgi:hypothetical protein
MFVGCVHVCVLNKWPTYRGVGFRPFSYEQHKLTIYIRVRISSFQNHQRIAGSIHQFGGR